MSFFDNQLRRGITGTPSSGKSWLMRPLEKIFKCMSGAERVQVVSPVAAQRVDPTHPHPKRQLSTARYRLYHWQIYFQWKLPSFIENRSCSRRWYLVLLTYVALRRQRCWRIFICPQLTPDFHGWGAQNFRGWISANGFPERSKARCSETRHTVALQMDRRVPQ